MNKAILIGNIATDIDLRVTPNGNYVAGFNLAVNEFNGETTFIPIETWKKQAENVANFCGKGSKVAVEGSIKIDKWEKEGQKRSFTKVNAFSIQFLDSKKDNQQQEQSNERQQVNAYNNEVKQAQPNLQNSGDIVETDEDDLPF